MEIDSNQPLDLRVVRNPSVDCYYNQRPIDFYEYQPFEAKPVYNNIYNGANNPAIRVAYKDEQSSESTAFSKKIPIECDKIENDLNTTFVIKHKRSQSFGEAKNHIGISPNSSIRKRKRSTTDEDREITSFTSNSATRSSILGSSLSSNHDELRTSPLTVMAKYEQAFTEHANGPESLLKGLVYHGTMARWHPNADNRTPEQAEQRRKNNQAARLSRARTNALNQKREEIAARTNNENILSKKTMAALIVYANELNTLLCRERHDWIGKWKRVRGALKDK